ncbi:TPA: WbuC family cupin fold metalloprotein [Klebsiella pneumoniae]
MFSGLLIILVPLILGYLIPLRQKAALKVGETCTVLEMAAGTWHAVLSLDTGGIIFEVKHGGYQPVAADDYAHWAPAEGEPGTTELMAWYAQAQVGDSTFAV